MKHFFRVVEEFGGGELTHRTAVFDSLENAVIEFKQHPEENIVPLIILEEEWKKGKIEVVKVYDIDGEEM